MLTPKQIQEQLLAAGVPADKVMIVNCVHQPGRRSRMMIGTATMEFHDIETSALARMLAIYLAEDSVFDTLVLVCDLGLAGMAGATLANEQHLMTTLAVIFECLILLVRNMYLWNYLVAHPERLVIATIDHTISPDSVTHQQWENSRMLINARIQPNG